MLAYAVTAFLIGFALFLLGFSIFMYRENRKFGDNQFMVKLLPPPPRKASPLVEGHVKTYVGAAQDRVGENVPLRPLSSLA